jgi:hypothetical protein
MAALMLSRNPDLTANDVRSIMQNTADKVGGNVGATAYNTNGFNEFYGFGRVNADRSVDAVPGASGDYNRDGGVNAADYVVWRKTNGSAVTPAYAAADGSGNSNVGSEDYGVWRSHFGQTITPAGPGSGAIVSHSLQAKTRKDGETSRDDIGNSTTVRRLTVAPTDNEIAGLMMSFQTTAHTNRDATLSSVNRRAPLARVDTSARYDEALRAWLAARPLEGLDEIADSHDKPHDLGSDNLNQDPGAVSGIVNRNDLLIGSAAALGIQ